MAEVTPPPGLILDTVTPPPGLELDTPQKKPAEMGLGKTMLKQGLGMAKTLGQQAENVGDIASLGLKPLLEKVIPPLGKARKQREALETPTGTEEKTGSTILQGAELLAPIPGVQEIKAGATAGRLARAGVTAARGALDIGLKTAVQTGSAKQAGEAAVAGGLTSAALEPVLSTIGRKIQASTIRPRLSDVKDGFKWSTLDKFKLKGSLDQSLKQVDSKLTELRNLRNAELAPGQGVVDLTKPFREATNELTAEVQDLKHAGTSKKTLEAMEALQQDILDVLSPSQKVLGNIDIRKAENLKEHLGTLGAWAYGRPDRESQTVEEVANKLYLKVKDAIEKSLGNAGPKVKSLNKQMQELIPVKNAMLARLPVEERNRLFSLQDIITMLPAIAGEPNALALTGLSMAQKSLRFGNWLSRNASSAATGAGRTAGTAVRLGQ